MKVYVQRTLNGPTWRFPIGWWHKAIMPRMSVGIVRLGPVSIVYVRTRKD